MLKAGSETGSLINHLQSGMRNVIPQVGDGATLLGWTDRHAATVVAVRETAKRVYVTLQRDRARRTDPNGFSEDQHWAFTPDPGAPKVSYTFVKQPDGTIAGIGAAKKVALGYRDEYYDFSF